MDIRLKTLRKTLLGRDCELCCNMNVLADVQEYCKGNLIEALSSPATIKNMLIFLAAMYNDCADSNGWPERVTPKELGRKLPSKEIFLLINEIPPLIHSAVQATADGAEPAEDNEKN